MKNYLYHLNFAITLLVALIINSERTLAQNSPPKAHIDDVITVLHGDTVHDPYRWLEDWSDPKTRQWSQQENAYARNYLDALRGRDALAKRIKSIFENDSDSYYDLDYRSGHLFAMKFQPPLNQPLLVVMPSAFKPEEERVIVNPNEIDTSGGTAMDWYVPSPDGKYVAVSMSRGGSEAGDLHIFGSESGKRVDETIERVNNGTAGGDVAWLPDGSGFYYTRYPREGEKPEEDLNFYQEVWMHSMGSPEKNDKYITGKDFPRIAEIRLQMDNASGMLLISVQYGDSGRFMQYLLSPDGSLKQLSTYEDKIVEAVFGPEENLYLISCRNAPNGKVLLMDLKNPILSNSETIIEESDAAIVSQFWSKSKVIPTVNYLYLVYQLGGPSEIRMFTHEGVRQKGPKILPVSTIGEMAALTGDKILYRNSSYLKPPAWYLFNPADGSTEKTALYVKSAVDFSGYEVVREFATSKDGTQVPVNIILHKGTKLDHSHPLLLTGYGGYGLSRTPSFSSIRKVWLEQGGIYAVANIRGGGEYGEKWHQAGMLLNKQNGFDDFAAVMEHLIDQGYTNRNKLAIIGGSNGGLLMGAMITQHPDLFRATVSSVGVYDMIRSELTPNGQFNIPEYGSVKDSAQFRALLAYSPYHNVKSGIAYPSILFMTGANDPRVDPMHSRKMIARLQAANTSDNPILLRTSSGTGHGIGTPLDERIKEDVDIYSFLFHEIGVKYQTVQ